MPQQRASNDHSCLNCESLRQEVLSLKEELADMKRHTRYDVLTGIPNRRFFVECLESRIARCRRYGDNSAVLFLDVDNLTAINDAHGHGAGDAQLACIANLIRSNTRSSDVVARIGDDEFGLLLDNLDSDQVEEKIAFLFDRLKSARGDFEGKKLRLSAAIGYCFVGPTDTVEGLLSRTDTAMYSAKD